MERCFRKLFWPRKPTRRFAWAQPQVTFSCRKCDETKSRRLRLRHQLVLPQTQTRIPKRSVITAVAQWSRRRSEISSEIEFRGEKLRCRRRSRGTQSERAESTRGTANTIGLNTFSLPPSPRENVGSFACLACSFRRRLPKSDTNTIHNMRVLSNEVYHFCK